ncbi:MAG: YebC/PmpR family DNA-binding transcriptional regulator [Candidatus Omnitrophica bacterium]|nr:YebC/PmpR family DNA-binding transcriptional regulator [Candidatus Omnitrophota bacterium]
MAGHSKWKGIKHKKAVIDAQRGKVFSRVIREITAAARLGGANPEGNPRLRLAIQKGRDANIPKDSVDKAIKRGTGELPGVSYEEMTIEGYGSGGVAILWEGLTDNKNRTSAEVRSIFSKHEGNLAGAGSVSWLFHKKGLVTLPSKSVAEDRLMDIVLEAGAEDLKTEGDQTLVYTDPQHFEAVKQALQRATLTWESAELTMIPSTTVKVENPAQVKSLLTLLDALEEDEDTQHVYANFDIPDALLAQQAA